MHGGQNMPEILGSFKPSDAVQGGFLDDVDGTIIDAYTTMYQYEGEGSFSNEPIPGIMIIVETGEGGEPINKFLKMGSAMNWVPNEDGTGLKPVGKATGFSIKANGMIFLTSLVNCNYPESAITSNIKETLIGLKCHFENQVIETKDKSIGKDGKYNVTIVTKIYELPAHVSDIKKSNSKSGKKATTASTSVTKSTSSPDELQDKAISWMVKVLSENPDGIPKIKLAPMIIQDPDFKGDSDQLKLSTIVFKTSFLETEGMPWRFDKAENKVYPAE